jgi:hypothetical protein
VLKIQAIPEVQIVDESNPLPKDVNRKFSRADAQLVKLGFRVKDTCLVPQAVKNITTILRLYLNYTQLDAAMTVTMFSNVDGAWTEKTHYVEFNSRLQNGREINTSNTGEISSFKTPSDTFSTHTPWIRNLSKLYKAHQGFVSQQSKGVPKVLRIQSEFNGNSARYVAAGVIHELESARKDGYLRLAPNKKHYLATIKGAYLMTWCELPPFKQIVRARKHAAARQRLNSI